MVKKIFFYKCLFLFLFISIVSGAKEFDDSFYRENLETKVYSIDPDASAVVLYENNTVQIIQGNMVYTKKEVVHKIIKIIKADAVNEGNINIYYPSNFGNYVDNIKGTTFNLSGDKIIKDSVNATDLLKKEINNGVYKLSFSMPSVKEGSIVDFSYEIVSFFTDYILTWHIQQDYPKLLTEYNIIYPKSIEFTTITHVRASFKEFSSKEDAEHGTDSFCVVKRSDPDNNECFWLRKNVIGIKREPYVVNIENQIESLALQKSAVGHFSSNHFMNSWEQINKTFWDKLGLDKVINNNNRFLNRVTDSLITPEMSASDKAFAVYNYIRSNFKVIQNNDNFLSKVELMDVYKYKEGNQDQINILLITMLNHAGIRAAPIILGTTDNISPNKLFPVMDRINYAACAATIDSGYVFMDASNRNNCFGLLPLKCYNGYSWILGDKGTGVNLTPDIIKEKTVYGIKLYDFGDSTAKLEITEKFGLFRSMTYRKTWADNREKSKEDIERLKSNLPDNIEVLESHIENENDPDASLIIKYSCVLNFDKNVTNFFIGSNLIKFFDKNPFKATSRKLPIEFPYKTEDIYSMNIILPKGVEPDSIAAPVIMSYEQDAIQYKKLTNYFPQLQTFTVSSSFLINTTSFSTDYYESIRTFIQNVIDDNNKVVVFKNKSKQ